MKMGNTCGHCAVINPSNGYCRSTGKYVNALDEKPCFVGKTDKFEPIPKRRTKAMRTEKACSRCGKTLPLEAFSMNRRNSDGRDCYCIQCRRERDRLYRLKRKEK